MFCLLNLQVFPSFVYWTFQVLCIIFFLFCVPNFPSFWALSFPSHVYWHFQVLWTEFSRYCMANFPVFWHQTLLACVSKIPGFVYLSFHVLSTGLSFLWTDHFLFYCWAFSFNFSSSPFLFSSFLMFIMIITKIRIIINLLLLSRVLHYTS